MRVDVWSDLVCPWCFIGLHRLRRLAASQAVAVDLVHHAFQLDPARTGSEPTRVSLARRYGRTEEQAEQMMRTARDAAKPEGLHLGLDTIACNTRDAHRLVALGQRLGRQDAVLDRLMQAHFTHGADLGDHGTLTRLAVEAGLPQGQVEALWVAEDFQAHVNADLDQARALGIHGVPFFLFAGQYAFSGAQPDDVFREALRLAADAELSTTTPEPSPPSASPSPSGP